MSYDIIVIGGGPAGSSAAIQIASKGYKVLLLEEDHEIGKPLQCGEAINEPVLKTAPLDELKDEFIIQKVSKSKINFPNGKFISTNVNSYIIDRVKFDKLLAKKAEEVGAVIKTNHRATNISLGDKGVGVSILNKNSHREVIEKAKGIIACDGFRSDSAKKVGLPISQLLVKALEYRIEGEVPNRLDFYFSTEKAPRGYFWVFPKGDNKANIGLVSTASNLRKKLNQFIKEKNLPNKVEQVIGGLIPAEGAIAKTYANRFLIAGDAARQTNPLFYGGIRIAVEMGKLAGEVISEGLEKNDLSEAFLKKYQNEWENRPFNEKTIIKAAEVFYGLAKKELNRIGLILHEIDMSHFGPKQWMTVITRFLARPWLWPKIRKLLLITDGWRLAKEYGF